MRVAFGRFLFDSETRELIADGRRLHVSPKAFDLLQVLLERRPKVVSKTELHARVWAGAFVGEANLSVTVAEVRQALGDDSREGKLIRTVHRVGYAFCGTAVDVGAEVPDRSVSFRCWLRWDEKSLQLADGESVIGRDPRCNIWVDASGVSRRHARVVVTAERVTIEDLGSSNGTFVRGTRIATPHQLTDGDSIEVGSATMTFRLWSDDRPPKTERIGRAGGSRPGSDRQ
jgi:DNA-binding winged helix-turn-helix (wHTH) protein